MKKTELKPKDVVELASKCSYTKLWANDSTPSELVKTIFKHRRYCPVEAKLRITKTGAYYIVNVDCDGKTKQIKLNLNNKFCIFDTVSTNVKSDISLYLKMSKQLRLTNASDRRNLAKENDANYEKNKMTISKLRLASEMK